ncbi:MAG: helicase RepA family protein [Propionibacteriaceae bacterium]|jgi:hypothetical protein|nr:helicase RepA family protein [Propionibacteriaceae bacterium]
MSQAIPEELWAAQLAEADQGAGSDSNTSNMEGEETEHALTRHSNTSNTSNTHGKREDEPVPELDWRDYVKTGAWLEAQEFPPLQFMVPGVLPEGFGVLVAPPKAGKSWLCLAFCLAVVTGGVALGCLTVRKRPVVYLALEDGDKRMKRRLKALLRDASIPPEFQYATDTPRDLVRDVIVRWLKENGPGLVIIDTLAKVRPPAWNREPEYDRDYRFGAQMQAICKAFPGTCILVVHHTRKARDDEDWMNSTLGSQGINGSADYTLGLFRRRGHDDATLKITGRDIEEAEYSVLFEDGMWELDGDSLEAASQAVGQKRRTEDLGDVSALIVRFVGEHPEGVTALMVSEAVSQMMLNSGSPEGIDKKNANTYLGRLTESGRVSRLRRGIYGPSSNLSVGSVGSVGMPSQTASNTIDDSVGSVGNATIPTPRQNQDELFQEALDLFQELDDTAPCRTCGQKRDDASLMQKSAICMGCDLETALKAQKAMS